MLDRLAAAVRSISFAGGGYHVKWVFIAFLIIISADAMRRKGFQLGALKIQSAMEYLMTYGWAILIIAIVMVALFALGVFNSANFLPRASAGACQVVRNVESTTLQGQCGNELPQYVAVFDGVKSFVSIPNSAGLDAIAGNTVTISTWIRTSSLNNQIIFSTYDYNVESQGYQSYLYNPGYAAGWDSYGPMTSSAQITDGAWHDFVITWNSGTSYIYVDGVERGGPYTGRLIVPATYENQIGTQCASAGSTTCSFYFDGYISNVQVYNSSLSANDVMALYREGIGGVPIDPTHILAWWPLNGNTNDYSGNGNAGVAHSISYTTSWTSGYSAP